MKRTICFDMDGTLADFYGVEDWLACLQNHDASPYREAEPLLPMNALARRLHQLQALGFEIKIISWLSKSGDEDFFEEIIDAKLEWLARHLPSVVFDEICIIPYGTPKVLYGEDILFDDERANREYWADCGFTAYDADDILNVLKKVTEM